MVFVHHTTGYGERHGDDAVVIERPPYLPEYEETAAYAGRVLVEPPEETEESTED